MYIFFDIGQHFRPFIKACREVGWRLSKGRGVVVKEAELRKADFEKKHKHLLLVYRISSFSFCLLGLYGLLEPFPKTVEPYMPWPLNIKFLFNREIAGAILVLCGIVSYLADTHELIDRSKPGGLWHKFDLVIAGSLCFLIGRGMIRIVRTEKGDFNDMDVDGLLRLIAWSVIIGGPILIVSSTLALRLKQWREYLIIHSFWHFFTAFCGWAIFARCRALDYAYEYY